MDVFLAQMNQLFQRSQDNMRRANQRSKALYDKRRHEVEYNVSDYVLLSTEYLFKRGTPQKLQRKFVGPYKVIAQHGIVAYELELPATWRRHPVFHVSLLKRWSGAFEPAQVEATDIRGTESDLESDEECILETERILCWRNVKRGDQQLKQFLITFKERPLDEATWVDEDQFEDPEELRQKLEQDNPTKDLSSL